MVGTVFTLVMDDVVISNGTLVELILLLVLSLLVTALTVGNARIDVGERDVDRDRDRDLGRMPFRPGIAGPRAGGGGKQHADADRRQI